MLTRFNEFTDSFYETGNLLAEWVMHRARQAFSMDRERRRLIVDPASFEKYRERCREKFLRSIGGLPDEWTKPKTMETGIVRRDAYCIRKLIYQSMPSVYVPALLYVPEGLREPAAAIFMGCGHGRDGKATPAYQKVCIDLVRAGFVVLIIDSPSHGEMIQCLCPDTGEPVVGRNVREHNFLQLSASIVGENIARYFLWNALRGIDLLADLPEVAADRIGMTGNSGGGTLTQYVTMVDSRIKAAMPCCSLSSRESYLATGVRSYDGEQNLFGVISDGLDYADLLAVFAPKPLRIGVAEFDFFCVEGVLETFEQVRSVYQSLGAEGALDLCLARDEPHGFSAPLRRGCVEWFARHLQGRNFEAYSDEPEVESPATLQCTRTGQVSREFSDARSILDLNRDSWMQKRSSGGRVTREELHTLLGVHTLTPLRSRCTKRSEYDFGASEHVFFFSEPGILVTAVVYLPSRPRGRAVLMLIPDGTEGQEAYEDEILSRVVGNDLVMVFDVRGTGAVRMSPRNAGRGLESMSTESRVAKDHFLLGTSLASRRAHDVLQAAVYLRNRSEVLPAAPLELVAHGWPAVYGLVAAAAGAFDTSSFSGLPGSWLHAFDLAEPNPEKISESLIFPEFAGRADVNDLLRLAGATAKL